MKAISRAVARVVPAGICFALGAVASPAAETPLTARVTIEQIATGIQSHIAEKSKANGGYFNLPYGDRGLRLKLVKIHMEYLSDLGGGVQFACVDLVGTDGTVYDVDFFLAGVPGSLAVTDTTVHKLNGRPLYAWEQKPDKTWERVPVEDAANRLLGVITDPDEFDFTYWVRLPELSGPARLWLPLAQSDAFQTVGVTKIALPSSVRELDERKHGNKVLFLTAGPPDSGKTLEIQYHVRRSEKSAYAAGKPAPKQDLEPDARVPVNATFRGIAEDVTRGKDTDLMRARALYDHVIGKIRYAKVGSGWGCGDATYACNAARGNCTDFHAYFIALARSIGIPARFAIGVAIPSERNDGGCDGYHCWAEFFADGKWWPVDISEANKNESLATYYFGHHPANRFEFSRGRDLVVEPGPAEGPINFLAYPVLEVDGKPATAEVRFLFTRSVSGTPPGVRRR